jgi:predicted phosphodiesterase
VAGDVTTGAPFARETVERVLHHGWAVIRGNNELYITDYGTERARPEWNDPVQFSVLHWTIEMMPTRLRAAIGAWPDRLVLRYPDAPPVLVTHASPRSHFEAMTAIAPAAELGEMLDGVEQSVVIVGHTHLDMDRTVGGWRVLNPGSAGQPLDGRLEAGYMLLEARNGAWCAEHRRVAYDQRRLFDEYQRTRFVERCGVIGELVHEEARLARTRLAPFLWWRRETCPQAPIDADLLARFRQEDVWTWTHEHFKVSR